MSYYLFLFLLLMGCSATNNQLPTEKSPQQSQELEAHREFPDLDSDGDLLSDQQELDIGRDPFQVELPQFQWQLLETDVQLSYQNNQLQQQQVQFKKIFTQQNPLDVPSGNFNRQILLHQALRQAHQLTVDLDKLETHPTFLQQITQWTLHDIRPQQKTIQDLKNQNFTANQAQLNIKFKLPATLPIELTGLQNLQFVLYLEHNQELLVLDQLIINSYASDLSLDFQGLNAQLIESLLLNEKKLHLALENYSFTLNGTLYNYQDYVSLISTHSSPLITSTHQQYNQYFFASHLSLEEKLQKIDPDAFVENNQQVHRLHNLVSSSLDLFNWRSFSTFEFENGKWMSLGNYLIYGNGENLVDSLLSPQNLVQNKIFHNDQAPTSETLQLQPGEILEVELQSLEQRYFFNFHNASHNYQAPGCNVFCSYTWTHYNESVQSFPLNSGFQTWLSFNSQTGSFPPYHSGVELPYYESPFKAYFRFQVLPAMLGANGQLTLQFNPDPNSLLQHAGLVSVTNYCNACSSHLPAGTNWTGQLPTGRRLKFQLSLKKYALPQQL